MAIYHKNISIKKLKMLEIIIELKLCLYFALASLSAVVFTDPFAFWITNFIYHPQVFLEMGILVINYVICFCTSWWLIIKTGKEVPKIINFDEGQIIFSNTKKELVIAKIISLKKDHYLAETLEGFKFSIPFKWQEKYEESPKSLISNFTEKSQNDSGFISSSFERIYAKAKN